MEERPYFLVNLESINQATPLNMQVIESLRAKQLRQNLAIKRRESEQ
jgi:hypothetical protein